MPGQNPCDRFEQRSDLIGHGIAPEIQGDVEWTASVAKIPEQVNRCKGILETLHFTSTEGPHTRKKMPENAARTGGMV